MSGGTGVIAGPEVDMADLDGTSSSSTIVANVVDLNLNLGPPLAPRDRLALELGLGGHDFEGSAQVARQNWPRFEPGMSGLLLAGGQEESDAPARGPQRSDGMILLSVNHPQQEFDRTEEVMPQSPRLGRSQGPLQGAESQRLESERLVGDRNRPLGEDFHLPSLGHRLMRYSRHSRHLRRPRQAIATALDRVEPQVSSGGSSAEPRFVGADESRPSFAICRALEGRRNSEAATACLDTSIATRGDKMSESNHLVTKEIEASNRGAHFECNICLDMATEPVVTCCGHLFCWPCLYQWLHVHSSQKECPVCKGSLSDSVVTPIYGRGTVQDADKSLTNIPPRPHAHRLNSKRRWQERVANERLDADGGYPVRGGRGGGHRSEVQRETGANPEGSDVGLAADHILHRLRVAQRVQREHIEERLRLRQRMMSRRGAVFRSPSRTGATPQLSLNQVQFGIRDSEQFDREQMLSRMAMNRLETVDRLAVIRASMDGLLENIANVQRSVQSGNSVSVRIGTSTAEEGISLAVPEVVEPVLGEERLSLPRTEVPVRGDTMNGDGQLQQGSAELLRAPRRQRHGAVGGASGSFDIEPGLLHARKRRRLN